MKNILTNKPLEFENKEDLIRFLSFQNPTFLRQYKKQYEVKYPDFEILGIGGEIIIKKKIKNNKN